MRYFILYKGRSSIVDSIWATNYEKTREMCLYSSKGIPRELKQWEVYVSPMDKSREIEITKEEAFLEMI